MKAILSAFAIIVALSLFLPIGKCEGETVVIDGRNCEARGRFGVVWQQECIHRF